MTPEQMQQLRGLYDKLAHAFEVDIERRDIDCGYIDYVIYGPDGDLCIVREDAVKRAAEKAKLIVAVMNAAPALFGAIERLQEELAEAHTKAELHWNAYCGAEARRKSAAEREQVAHDHRAMAEQDRVGRSGSTIEDVEALLSRLGEAPKKYNDATTAVHVIQRISDQRDAAEANAVQLEQKLDIAHDLEDELRTELAEQKRNVLIERAEKDRAMARVSQLEEASSVDDALLDEIRDVRAALRKNGEAPEPGEAVTMAYVIEGIIAERDRGYEYLQRWQTWARELSHDLHWVPEDVWPDDTETRVRISAALHKRLPPPAIIDGAVAVLREWRNDGADGESAHLVCDALEAERARAAELETALAKQEEKHAGEVHDLTDAHEAVLSTLRTDVARLEKEIALRDGAFT